jgi:hypothetical protein
MIYYVDGWMKHRNPCQTGGFTVVNESDVVIAHTTITVPRLTNLHTEILAIAYGAFHAKPQDTIITDCQPALFWARNGYAGARPDLTPIARKAHDWIRTKQLTLKWEPRETNRAGWYNEKIDRR